MTGTIAEIRSAVIEGTSVYYLRFEGEDGFLVYASAATIPSAPLLNVGDSVTVYWTGSGQWITARSIVVENRAVAAPPEAAASGEETSMPEGTDTVYFGVEEEPPPPPEDGRAEMVNVPFLYTISL